jgi:protein-S-isoprenylcysteine O-methyltransferase Ste14
MLTDVAVSVCWGLFGVVWARGALYNTRRAPDTRRRSFGSSLWLLAGNRRLARRAAGPRRRGSSWHTEPEAIRLLGAALLVLTTGFIVWARVTLGTMWSSSPVAKEGHVLRTDGPYSVTRHPIYTGILGMLLTTAIALGFGAWLYVVPLVIVFFELQIRAEEKLLNEAFSGCLRGLSPACPPAPSRRASSVAPRSGRVASAFRSIPFVARCASTCTFGSRPPVTCADNLYLVYILSMLILKGSL